MGAPVVGSLLCQEAQASQTAEMNVSSRPQIEGRFVMIKYLWYLLSGKGILFRFKLSRIRSLETIFFWLLNQTEFYLVYNQMKIFCAMVFLCCVLKLMAAIKILQLKCSHGKTSTNKKWEFIGTIYCHFRMFIEDYLQNITQIKSENEFD